MENDFENNQAPPLVITCPRYDLYLPPHFRLCLLFLFSLLVCGYTRGIGLAIFDEAELDARGPIFYASALIVPAFVVTALRFRKTGLLRNFYFQAITCSYIAIAFADVIGGVRIYHQPLLGIFRDFFWYAGLLIFPILFMWRGDIRFLKQTVHIYVGIAMLSAVLCNIASFAPQVRDFISAGTQSERFGLTRIRSIEIVPFAFYYFLVKFTFQKQRFSKSCFSFICFCMIAFNLFYVSITRQIIISLLVSSVYYLFRYCRFKIKSIKISLFLLLFCTSLVLNLDSSNIVSKTFSSFSSSADSVDKSNVYVRMESAVFYWEQFKNTDFMGIGKISSVHSTDNEITKVMEDSHYFLADLGVLAVLYQYGLPAIIILMRVICRGLKDLRSISKVAPSDLASIAIAVELTLVGDIARMWFMFFRNDLCFFYAFYFFIIVRITAHLKTNAVDAFATPINTLYSSN